MAVLIQFHFVMKRRSATTQETELPDSLQSEFEGQQAHTTAAAKTI